MNNNKTQNRKYGLDIFRSFAILCVLIGHTFQVIKVSPQIEPLGSIGILGVELFFVLSGFLLGPQIIDIIENKSFPLLTNLIRFWRKRWLRTLPLYYIAYLAFTHFDWHGSFRISDHLNYLVFAQSFNTRMPDFFELSWSLAIEEHFYIWFPLLLIALNKITNNSYLSIALSGLTLLITSYGFRLNQPLFVNFNDFEFMNRLPVLSRMDSIFFGVLVAALKQRSPMTYEKILKLTPLTATLFFLTCAWWCAMRDPSMIINSRIIQINLWTFQSILCALLLPWFDALKQQGFFYNYFTLTSKISYSLYLMHVLIITLTKNVLQHLGISESVFNNPFLAAPILFSLYYFISWLSYLYIESPFQKLRHVPFEYKNFLIFTFIFIFLLLY